MGNVNEKRLWLVVSDGRLDGKRDTTKLHGVHSVWPADNDSWNRRRRGFTIGYNNAP